MDTNAAQDYLIRLATRDEIDILPSIERRAACLFEGWLAETGLTRALLDEVSKPDELEAARERGHLWVAVASGGEVVGFVGVVVLDGLAHLDEIDVVPEHGRKGVGTRLVAAVCRWATEAGFPKVTLSTFGDVPWNRAFYEKQGFRVVDPSRLGPEHVGLVAAERGRGLRTDLRVVMEYPLTASP